MAFSRSSLLLACTAMAILPVTHLAFAQDAAADGTQLETIVVKGKRAAAVKGSEADTPLATQTSAEQLRQKEVNSLSDLGSTLDPGVDFVKTRPGASGGLYIRGMSGARLATLIDGIPVSYLENGARSGTQSPVTTTGDSTDSFDFSSLSTIDVLKGADSSRLGSGGLGGGLSLRTLEPEDLIGEGKTWGGVAKATYDSADKSTGGSLAIAGRSGNTSVLFQGGYKKGHESDNQGTVDTTGLTRTKANPSDYDQTNILLKARQDIEGGHRIGVTAERFRLDRDTDFLHIQGTGGTSNTTGIYQPGYGGYEDTARDRVSLEYNYEAPEAGSVIDSASLVAYWQRIEKGAGSSGYRKPAAIPAYLYDRKNSLEESSYGLTGWAVSSFDTGNLAHELRYGGNISLFKAESFLAAIPTTTTSQSDIPDIHGTRFGFFVEDEITIGNSGFAVTPGVRFDGYNYNPKLTPEFQNNTGYALHGFPKDVSDTAFSPKLLATYQLTPEVELFAQWSMAYRAPTVSEMYINFTNGAMYTVIGNPNLQPETANGFEVGANYSSNDLEGRIAVFHNRYKNYIEIYNPNILGAFDQSWRNIANAEISGVELSARKEFANGVSLYGNLSYTYGKNSDTGAYLRTVAPFKAITGIAYNAENWGTDLSGVFSASMRSDNRPATFDAPGYGVFNLSGWWEPEQTNGLRIQAGIYNLFDKKYWNAVGVRDVNPVSATANQPVDFYSEPGRTFKISLTQKF